MITRPKVMATPTCPRACVLAATMIAPAPAKTRAKVPNASATRTRASCRRGTSAATGARSRRSDRERGRNGVGLCGLDNGGVHPVGHLVGEGDRDIDEPRRLQTGFVLALREGAGDAAHVTPTF